MLYKQCKQCGKLIPYGSAYCSACATIAAKKAEERKKKTVKQYNRRYDAKRDSKLVKFYNSKEWRQLCRIKMRNCRYRCERCGAMLGQIVDGKPTKLQVHHLNPIQTPEGWSERLEYGGLICLCLHCHNEEHNRFKKNKNTGVP